ncbi:MAG: winged helix-turn-helix domain-containing protein [Pyrinomonadaceae bacterium]
MSRQTQHFYEFGQFRLDPTERLLLREGGAPVPLTAKVFDLLLLLVERRGQLIAKEEIFGEIWPDRFVDDANLTVNISTLRKLLGEDRSGSQFIETVPKRGYRFVAKVTKIEGETDLRIAEAEIETLVSVGKAAPAEEVNRVASFPAVKAPDEPTPAIIRRRPRIIVTRSILFAFALIVVTFTASWFTSKPREHQINAQIRSLAVLPFKSQTGEDVDALEVGLADTVISKLSSFKQITVRPKSAILKYSDHDPIAAGREQGVDAVLDGRIQKAGNRVRVSAQLMRVRDQQTLWSGTFDEQITDIFALQDQLSLKVAEVLMPDLTKVEERRLAKPSTVNLEAYKEYIRGRYHWDKRTGEGLQKAVQHFNQAIDLDPAYAEAYAGLSDSYNLLGVFGVLPISEITPKARAAAHKALEIDQTLAEAHSSLAAIKEWYERDMAGAEREYRQAIEYKPSYPTAHQWYALYLSKSNRHAEAVTEIRRAEELDPLSLIISSDAGVIFRNGGQHEQAVQQFQKTIRMGPNFTEAHVELGRTYAFGGRHEEAIEKFVRARELSGNDPSILGDLGYVYAVAGRKEEALKILEELKDLSRRRFVPNESMILIYAALGDNDLAFELLEKEYEAGSDYISSIKNDPRLNRIRSDVRFTELLRRAGL